jgi:thiamine kinase-like enzyme
MSHTSVTGVPFESLDPSDQTAVEKACAHISDLGATSALAIERLTGGITNRNFRLKGGTRDVVLRLHGKDTALLGIDRHLEHASAVQAAALGLGPNVAGLIEPELYLLTDFVEAVAADLHTPAVLATVVSLLRRWHESAPIPGSFDTFGLAETFALRASFLGVQLPAEVETAVELSTTVGAVFAAIDEPLVPCHNDLLAANFLSSTDRNDRVWLIDWEYAGMNSRWFDLGNLSINNGFEDDANESLLRLYFGSVTPRHRACLTLMRVMSDVREAMWGVLQQGISSLDFDYADYARQHFHRMMMNATSTAFGESLALAAHR